MYGTFNRVYRVVGRHCQRPIAEMGDVDHLGHIFICYMFSSNRPINMEGQWVPSPLYLTPALLALNHNYE